MGMRVICRIFRFNSDNLAQPLYYTALIGLLKLKENMMVTYVVLVCMI